MAIVPETARAGYSLSAPSHSRSAQPRSVQTLYEGRRPTHVSIEIWREVFDAIVVELCQSLVGERIAPKGKAVAA